MPVTRQRKVDFARLVAEEFLRGKDDRRLNNLSQDEIDAYVIPIMTEVEDLALSMVSEKVLEAVKTEKLSPTDEWWD